MKTSILLIALGILLQFSPSQAAESLVEACTETLSFADLAPSGLVRQCLDLAKSKNLTVEDIEDSRCERENYAAGSFAPTPQRALDCLYGIYGDHQPTSDFSNDQSSMTCEIELYNVKSRKTIREDSFVIRKGSEPYHWEAIVGSDRISSYILFSDNEETTVAELDWTREDSKTGKILLGGFADSFGTSPLRATMNFSDVGFNLRCEKGRKGTPFLIP